MSDAAWHRAGEVIAGLNRDLAAVEAERDHWRAMYEAMAAAARAGINAHRTTTPEGAA